MSDRESLEKIQAVVANFNDQLAVLATTTKRLSEQTQLMLDTITDILQQDEEEQV